VKKNACGEEGLFSADRGELKRNTLLALGVIVLVWLVYYSKIFFGGYFFWDDLVHQEYPHRLFARDSFLTFQFPHWNPYTYGGMPFFAAIHTGVLYPFNILLSLLNVSDATYWFLINFVVTLHILCAGVSMFFFIRSLKYDYISSVFAAFSYMFCGFLVLHVNHSLMLYILAWMPLVFLFYRRAALEKRSEFFLLSGLILGISVFAGHPQITFYEILALIVYAVYLFFTVSDKKITSALWYLSPLVVALCIPMVQLLSTWELSKESARVGWTFADAAEGSMSLRQFLGFFMPNLFGCQTTNYEHIAYWVADSPLYKNGRWTYWESTFYMGLPVILLALAQLVNIKKNRFVQVVFIWTLFTVFVSLGEHSFVYKFLFSYIPGFGSFRFPARIMVTLNFLFPVLAVKTLNDLEQKEQQEPLIRFLLVPTTLCTLWAGIVITGAIAHFWSELEAETFMLWTKNQTVLMIFILILFALLITLFMKGAIPARLFKQLMVALLIMDLFIFSFGQQQQTSLTGPGNFDLNNDLRNFLREDARRNHMRANIRHLEYPDFLLLRRNQGIIDKIRILAGYNPLSLNRRLPPTSLQKKLDLMSVTLKIDIDSATESAGIVPNLSALPRAVLFYKTRVFDSDSQLVRYMGSDAYNHYKTVVLEKEPTYPVPGETEHVTKQVSVRSYENNRIEIGVSTSENAVLWLSEIWYPAWKATLDGSPCEVLRANYCFRAVSVPEGNHTIVFTFQSTPFRIGLWLSLLSFIATIGGIVVFLRRRRRDTRTGTSAD